jgi:hypothetical protein
MRRAAFGVAIALLALVGLSACSGEDPASAASQTTTAGQTSSATSPPATSAGSTATTPPSGMPASAGVSPQPPLATPPFDQSGEATSAPPTQADVLDWLPGDPGGACVNTDGESDLRSGGIAAGSFDEATESYASGAHDVDLHWIPAHAEDLTGLTVTATQISGGSGSFVVEQDNVSELVDESGTWRYYFLTDFDIPSPGLWRFEATSGEDAGCFTVTFTS